METKTYRAKSMQDALDQIRYELGPNAAVLHTREVRGGLLRRLMGGRQIEVTASATVNVPSRLPAANEQFQDAQGAVGEPLTMPCRTTDSEAPAHQQDYRSRFRESLNGQHSDLHTMMEEFCRQQDRLPRRELPDSLFELFTDLIDAEVSEELARELVDRVRSSSSGHDLDDALLLKARIARLIEEELESLQQKMKPHFERPHIFYRLYDV